MPNERIIRAGAKMVNAVANSVCTKNHGDLRRSFGAGNYAMCATAYIHASCSPGPPRASPVMSGDAAASTLVEIQTETTRTRRQKKSTRNRKRNCTIRPRHLRTPNDPRTPPPASGRRHH